MGKSNHLAEFITKMKREEAHQLVIDSFTHYYNQIVTGKNGLIYDRDIQPLKKEDIENVDGSSEPYYRRKGKSVLKNAVRIVLNGGLGTSMGLTGPKSLLKIKHEQSFLNIIIEQAENNNVKLLLMNSFSTQEDTHSALSKLHLSPKDITFIQNKFPKVVQNGYYPAAWPQNPKLEWNPPGHGDVYTALYTSGKLQNLLSENIQYAFISNADNLGARMDISLLGYFAQKKIPFMMEVAEKTPSDIKGGHLARYNNGRLILREVAQCSGEECIAFQNIHPYRYFNTNSIWINLKSLKELFDKQKTIYLPMILNPKRLDPRDESSPPVFQIETAMGAAISLFDKAAAVRVPRSRFFPVKTCSDLLAARSDLFVFTKEKNLIINPNRSPKIKHNRPKINLDSKYYGKIDNLEKRFPKGPPSLVDCESLTIEGDVGFERDVTVKGSVCIENRQKSQKIIKAGTFIDQDLIL